MDPLRRPLLSVLLVAGLIRAAALGFGWDALGEDPDAYVAISRTLANTGVFGLTGADAVASATAFRPPLYPTILATLSLAIITLSDLFGDPLAAENSIWFRGGVALLHLGLGLLTAAATYWAARRLLRHHAPSVTDAANTRAAWFAALLVSCDPILLQSSTRVMTETLATALASLALLSWATLVERLAEPQLETQRGQQKTTGGHWLRPAVSLVILLGLAYLCRPTFIVWTLLLVGYLTLWAFTAGGRLGKRFRFGLRPLAVAAVLLAVTAIFVGGWTLRNLRHFGHPIWATTHGGYTLLLGNNPFFYRYLRTGQVGIAWDPEEFFQAWESRTQADPRRSEFWDSAANAPADPRWQALRPAAGDEVAQDRLAYEAAIAAIRHDPSGFVHACLWRVGRLLSPLPQRFGGPPGLGIIAVTVFYCGVLLLVLAGAFRLGRRLLQPPWAASLTLLLALIAVHAFYWTNMRMRAPAVPVLGIIAAAALLRPRPNRQAADGHLQHAEHQGGQGSGSNNDSLPGLHPSG